MPDPTPEPISTEPNTSKRWIIPFIAVVFAMMAMQMSSLGFSPLLPDIQHDFGINYSQVGLFSGVYGLAAIVCSIPGGILAKRFGEKNVLTIGLVVVAFGWRNGILAFGGMALLGAIVFWIFYHAPKAAELRPPAAGHGIAAAPDASAFSNPLVWSMVLLGLTNMGGFSANFFVPSAVKSTFGLGPTVAAYIMSAAYVTAIFANILTGYLADRSNRWAVMIGIMLLLIPSCFAMMSTSLIVFRVATALVISLGLCATNQIFAIAGEVMPGREMGPVMGIVSLGGGIFGYIGPQTLGILRDRTGGYTAGWYFVAFGALIGLVVILILKRAAGKPELPQMQVAPNA
jgi:nitrate/nitrite transporter NarK